MQDFSLLRAPIAALDFSSDRSRSEGYAHGHSSKSALHSARSRRPKKFRPARLQPDASADCGVGFFLGPIAHMDVPVRRPGVPDSPGAKSGLCSEGYAHGHSPNSALRSTRSRRPKTSDKLKRCLLRGAEKNSD